MTNGQDLVVAAEVRRGGFVLEVAFTVEPGEVVGVLGPNGSGKSTLLKALAGLIPVSTGRITLGGRVVDDAGTRVFAEPASRPVGFVFQDYRLFPHLSVLENVAFSPRSRGLGRPAARAVATHWMERLRLGEFAGRKPAALSGGQAQRVALARALAGEPELLLLDEPLSALDAGTRLDVESELRAHLAEFGGPCLIVTHDPLEALVLADRLIVLEGGRIVQEGSPGQVARQPATDYVAKLVGLNLYQGVGTGPFVELATGGRFEVPGRDARGDVLVAVRPSAVAISHQRPEQASPRNVWQAKITGLTLLADRVRLEVDGEPPALVDVTAAAVTDLSLAPGSEVWLAVKATDLEVYRRGTPGSG